MITDYVVFERSCADRIQVAQKSRYGYDKADEKKKT